jgi:pyruvate/2-oxoglutarate/acetoin dehydrogenase E1 component
MKRVLGALNEAMHEMMELTDEVLFIGEDVLDPYGGAFKVAKGLSHKYPDRVITTPISEAGIVGLGIGLALRGFAPVVEIMFGDFTTLIADQLINQASKIALMFGKRIDLRLVVRTPMGGRRGYGPTHSQTLERLFCGIPGLVVAAVSNVYDPGIILKKCVLGVNSPVLLVENKTLYGEPILTTEALAKNGLALEHTDELLPTTRIYHAQDEASDITIVTYGGMVPIVLDATRQLRSREGLICEMIVPHQISPLSMETILRSVQRSKRLIVVEEGIVNWGWGSEVVTRVASQIRLEAPAQIVGAECLPIPACRVLEEQVLPQAIDVVNAAIRTVDLTFDGD